MIKNYVEIKRTARYFQSKLVDSKVKHVVFLLHGYAQNADSFLNSFSALQNEEILLVAPEGLSKFYWKDFSSNPASSWMTSLERENEIKDTINYLNTVLIEIENQLQHKDVQFHVLGFSQGTATASRFVTQCNIVFSNLFLYAGKFAHDLDFNLLQQNQKALKFHFVYGTEDYFINEEQVKEASTFLNEQNIQVNTFSFKGKHKIENEAIAYLKQIIL